VSHPELRHSRYAALPRYALTSPLGARKKSRSWADPPPSTPLQALPADHARLAAPPSPIRIPAVAPGQGLGANDLPQSLLLAES